MESNSLQHVGVLGMKWGHRKAAPKSALKKKLDNAKNAKKRANREYTKTYNDARNNPLNGFTKKGQEKWNKAIDSAEKVNKASAKYKAVKLERKTAIKSKTAELEKNTSIGEKLLFNTNTRKLAAKYVVDNNMSVAEATKKSHEAAIKNTVIFMAAYGGLMYAALKK